MFNRMKMRFKLENVWLGISVVGLLLGGNLLWGSNNKAFAGDPVPYDGNPSCVSFGYANGFKPEPQSTPWGTHTIPGTSYTITVSQNNLGTIDWSSTLGMDAVLVKGGPNGNRYIYEPPTESFGDTGLHPQTNPNNGQFYGLSHLEFCFDFEVRVTKTANTTYTRTHSWDIDKTVDDSEHRMFAGETSTSNYEVALTKTSVDSNWAVNGQISIFNPDPNHSATITTVVDTISGVGVVPVNCGFTLPQTITALGTLNCTYQSSLPDGTIRTNTATATTMGSVGGGSGTAAVTFGAPTTTIGFNTVNVNDSLEGDFGPFSNSTTFNYSHDFTCSTNLEDYLNGTYNFTTPNTATITQTGQSDSRSVITYCYAPTLAKTATTSFARQWSWDIDKTADTTSLELEVGETAPVNYSVTVQTTGFTDGSWAAEGDITITNPHPTAIMTVSLADLISGGISATLTDCTSPVSVDAASTTTCHYTAALPDGTNRINTATATINGLNVTATADVAFGDPTTLTDECITVKDSMAGDLGQVCQGDAPETFNYSETIGNFQACGDFQVNNTADFVTNDTAATGDASWLVNVTVPCDLTCTLTIGYWKTHGNMGPASYDETWDLRAGGSASFFISGKTWLGVAWTPTNGNGYYILAHQYIAAKLNILDGDTSTTMVNGAITAAETFFSSHNPLTKLSKTEKAQVTMLAGILDQYNNGLIGPGHCE